jgi:hypothetical protein
VILKSGEIYTVQAVNEWHAGSQVVFGDGPAEIEGTSGRVLNNVKVHRDNISSIRLLEAVSCK